jgi:hypothetical protein
MKQTFKEYLALQTPTRKMLGEGGNAIKSSSRINQLNVEATLTALYGKLENLLGVKRTSFAVLGSTGKKDPSKNGEPEGSSGDIDLAIDLEAVCKALKCDQEDVVSAIKEAIESEFSEINPMPGLNIVSVAFPISNEDGNQDGKFVQVDLMPVDSLEWAKWAYYSPSFKESNLKGLYRNELMYAVARYMEENVIDSNEDGPVTWERYFFDLAKGLLKGTQTRQGKTKVTKGVKTLDKTTVTKDPVKAVKMMFGNAKPNDLLTFEQTLAFILSDKFVSDKKEDILKMAAKGIVQNKKMPLPKELESYYD